MRSYRELIITSYMEKAKREFEAPRRKEGKDQKKKKDRRGERFIIGEKER